jgi:hypothetical protein
MLIGYSIIAVPTGILTAELGSAAARRRSGDGGGPKPGDGLTNEKPRCPHCGGPL